MYCNDGRPSAHLECKLCLVKRVRGALNLNQAGLVRCQVADMLNRLYEKFDAISDELGVSKVPMDEDSLRGEAMRSEAICQGPDSSCHGSSGCDTKQTQGPFTHLHTRTIACLFIAPSHFHPTPKWGRGF
jgi:hypothetical protein